MLGWLVRSEDAKGIGSMSLLGDEGVELFLGDDAVLVKVSTLDHFLENVVVS